METVEVLIRIPKQEFEELQGNYVWWGKHGEYIKKGTVLPKGHGRLVDAEKIAREVNRAWALWQKKGEDCYVFADILTPLLISQPTVIEADKGVDNE